VNTGLHKNIKKYETATAVDP